MRSTLRFLVPLVFSVTVTAGAMAVAYQGLQHVAASHVPPDLSRVTHAVLDSSCPKAQPAQPTVDCLALLGDATGGCPFLAEQGAGQCPALTAPQDHPGLLACPFLEGSEPHDPGSRVERIPDRLLAKDLREPGGETRPSDPV
jgi:hypothetical protein